jgi:hypothetical protein
MYPWPFAYTDPVLCQALDIAMDYLDFAGQAEDYRNVETLVIMPSSTSMAWVPAIE